MSKLLDSKGWALPIRLLSCGALQYTLVALSILTGRRHQIRVQLGSRGCLDSDGRLPHENFRHLLVE
ncbi:unnamed protein product [Symbiodinium natans]|uniref:Uncharacterized protein n=1 Tax=Symbiodinium natans TaxID=878477 RepID=A0A812L915_9DINO|nr:unnamed protein product [Symbiodinium natans]